MVLNYIFNIFHFRDVVLTHFSTGDSITTGDQVDQTDSSSAAASHPKKGPRYVHELCTKGEECSDKSQKSMIKTMFQQSDLYIWLVLMMGTFYGIPAIQLVFKYQEALAYTGNNDLCYYNSLCSIPIGKVQDFNHILSNIGYISFGLTFLCIVWYRYIYDVICFTYLFIYLF